MNQVEALFADPKPASGPDPSWAGRPAPRRVLLCFNTAVMHTIGKALRGHVDFLATALPAPHNARGFRNGVGASRIFDASVWLPPAPVEHWSVSGGGATEEVRRYVEHVAVVCERLSIEAIVPINDAETYFLTLFADRLAEVGTRVLGPPHNSVLLLGDKLACAELAEAAGIAVPRTVSVSAVVHGTQKVPDLPVLVKRRFSAGASTVEIFHDRTRLLEFVHGLPESEHAEWLVQEFIPGNLEPSATVFMTPGGRSSLLLQHIKHRYLGPSSSTAVETVEPFVEEGRLVDFLAGAGAVGPIAAQFKVDRRDGVAKLIEINPRLGQNSRLVFSMLAKVGHDPGRLLLDSCVTEASRRAVLPTGTIGLSPADDLLAFGAWCRARRSREREDNSVPEFGTFLRNVVDTYRKPVIAFDGFFRSSWSEPAVVLPTYWRQLRIVRDRRVDLIPWTMAGGGSGLPSPKAGRPDG